MFILYAKIAEIVEDIETHPDFLLLLRSKAIPLMKQAFEIAKWNAIQFRGLSTDDRLVDLLGALVSVFEKDEAMYVTLSILER